jgi:hypothetical protein
MKTVASTALTSATSLGTMLAHRLTRALIRTQDWVQEHRPTRQQGQRGVIMVEFVLLTAAIAIPVAVAFVSLGMPLLRYFRYAQMALVGPLP